MRPPAPLRRAAAAARRATRALALRLRGAEGVFAAIYRRNAWQGDESGSGPGSSLAATDTLRRELPPLLARLRCASLLDAPCGDFWWLKETALPVGTYHGVDIVAAVVAANQQRYGTADRTFLHRDLCRDPLPHADLVLCRDGLVHLSYRDIAAAFANLRRTGATWLLATTFPHHRPNRDIVTGEWRPLNLELPPFSFPPPQALLNEHCRESAGAYHDKSLGLWRLADLPNPLPPA